VFAAFWQPPMRLAFLGHHDGGPFRVRSPGSFLSFQAGGEILRHARKSRKSGALSTPALHCHRLLFEAANPQSFTL